MSDLNRYFVMTVHLVLCGHDCPECGCYREPRSARARPGHPSTPATGPAATTGSTRPLCTSIDRTQQDSHDGGVR